MKLIELKLTDESIKYYYFTIKIEVKTIFGKTKVLEYDCFKEKKSFFSTFIKDGICVFFKYRHLDESINAILNKESKNYKLNK